MISFIMDFLLYTTIGFLIYFNILIFCKSYRAPYPSNVDLMPLARNETPFSASEKALALEEALIKLDFYILGYTVLRSRDNTFTMVFNHPKNRVMCLVYLNEKAKNIAYEFFLEPLSGKDILIASSDMPLTFDSAKRDFYRISPNLTITLAYLSIFQRINKDDLQALPDTIEEFLHFLSNYLQQDASQKTQLGLLSKTKEKQEFQNISLKGALTVLLRSGIPTGFYFAHKQYSRFNHVFLNNKA